MYSSAFSVGKRTDREWCYQRIANNGLCNCTSSDDFRARMCPTSWQQKDISFQSRQYGVYDQELQDAWNPLSSSRKWTPLQANTPDILAIIKEQMRVDDETTATQLVKIVNAVGYDVSKSTIVRARRILRWTFHGSRYCQMIRAQNKEKRMGWARKNLHKKFEIIV